MRILTLIFSACSLMAACAVDPPNTKLSATPSCVERTTSIGSNIMKRQECSTASSEERDQAQQTARDMRDDQIRSGKMSRPGSGSGSP